MAEEPRIPPRVFVSSTYYDLKQVRSDLRRFIEDDLGYTALLSEYDSFPVDPDASTIENCMRRVRDDTDVLVLIIGSRHGFVPDGNARSIVNMEYVAAREAGIPVFAFIEASVLPLYDAWCANHDIDLRGQLNDMRLLPFIQSVRETDGTWMHPFAYAQEIIDALRRQMAFRSRRALRFLSRLERREDQSVLAEMSGAAVRMALDAQLGWVGEVFSSCLQHGIDSWARQREDYEHEIAIGPGEAVPEGYEQGWAQAQIDAALRMMRGMNNFINVRLMKALAEEDLGALVRGAASLVELYREAMEWSHRIRCASVSERWQPVQQELARSTVDVVHQLETLGPRLSQEMRAAIEAAQAGEDVEVNIVVTITMPNRDRLSALMDCL